MSLPAARVTDATVTSDLITGPGVPTVLIGGMPAAIVGDLVSGPVCTGTITQGSSTLLIGGRPAARVTSQVNGVNNQSGAPMTTVIATGCPTVVIS